MKQYLYPILVLSVLLALSIARFSHAKAGVTITLSKGNTVALNMPIDGGTASTVQQQLSDRARRLRGKDPIYLVLNSPGGSVVDGQRIIETAKGLPNEVHTITIFSASMSFILSQYLNKRLILESGTMMSHRASASGLSGQVPGSLITRALALLSSISEIEEHVAARAHIPLPDYQKMIADELWLTGVQAVSLGFADQVVRVQCEPGMAGPGDVQVLNTFFGKVKVTWNACPLITEPYALDFGSEISDSVKKQIIEALYNKASWARGVGFVTPVNNAHSEGLVW